MPYSYEVFKEYQIKKTISDAEENFHNKMNTKLSIDVYEYFGCSGPIKKCQFEKYNKYLNSIPPKWKYLGNNATEDTT